MAITVAMLLCSPVWGQTTEQLVGFDLERLDTNVGRGTLLVSSGEMMKAGGLNVSLIGHYQQMPFVLSDGEEQIALVKHRATTLLAASFGLLDWLELSAQLPFVLWQQGDDPKQLGLSKLNAQGLGTPLLQAKLKWLSQEAHDLVDLAVDVGAGLPIGNGSALAGDAGPRFYARIPAGMNLGWLHQSFEMGVLFRPTIVLATEARATKPGVTSELHLGASLATTGTGLRGDLSVRALFIPEASQVAVDLLGGIRFPFLSGLNAVVQAGPSFGNAVGTPRFRVLLGITYLKEPEPSFEEYKPLLNGGVTKSEPERRREGSGEAEPAQPWEIARNEFADVPEGQDMPQPKRVRPYQLREGEQLVVRGEIGFSKGSVKLPDVVPLLDQLALRLSEQPTTTVLVEGHADEEGNGISKIETSLRRAQAVRQYLINQGVDGTRVRLRGLGSDAPVSAKPATEAERQLNRRAEVLLLSPGAPVTTQATSP